MNEQIICHTHSSHLCFLFSLPCAVLICISNYYFLCKNCCNGHKNEFSGHVMFSWTLFLWYSRVFGLIRVHCTSHIQTLCYYVLILCEIPFWILIWSIFHKCHIWKISSFMFSNFSWTCFKCTPILESPLTKETFLTKLTFESLIFFMN